MTSVTIGRRRGRRRDDRLAFALLAYGFGGVVLILLTLVLTLASLGAIERLAHTVKASGPEGIGARLAPVEDALTDAQAAVEGFDATLSGTSDATVSGRALTARLADTLRTLAASLDVTILGSRPFAGVGTSFLAVASDADALATDLETTTSALAANREALQRLGDRIGDLRAELADLRAELVTADTQQPSERNLVPAAEAFTLSRAVLVLLLAWLAIPPTVAAWIALQRLRRPPALAAPEPRPDR